MSSKRPISVPNENALLARVIRPILFVRLDFSSGIQRYHTEIGPRTAVHPIFGSENYNGVGDFGGITSDVVESVSGAPAALSLTLSGVGPISNQIFVDDYHGRSIELMLGLDDESGTLIDDPEILYSGFMDKADFALREGESAITLVCEGRGIRGLTSSDQRFTDEDKQAEVPGDLLAEYVYKMRDLTLRWGDESFRSPLGGGRGSGSRGRGRRSRRDR